MKHWRISFTTKHKGLFLPGLAAFTVLSAVLSICFGTVSVSPGELLHVLLTGGPFLIWLLLR